MRVLVSDPAAPDRVNMNQWDPIHSLGSRQECTDQLRAMNYRFDTGAGYVYSKDGKLWQASCLPDTVDPRGLKGK